MLPSPSSWLPSNREDFSERECQPGFSINNGGLLVRCQQVQESRSLITLYFNYSSDLVNGTNSTLYTVNTSTGALTAVGSGLGSGILALFSDGNALYGIDANLTSDIGVFRIDTMTGVATQVSTVTGLPGSNNFYVDAATVSTPDAGPTLALFIFALAPLLGRSRLRRCLKASDN